jgi:ATP-binding cassette subfamily B multidrug efflux pump
VRKKSSNINAFIHESFAGIRVIQAFAKERETLEIFLDLVRSLKDSWMRAVRVSNAFWPLIDLSWAMGSVIVYWYGTRLLGMGDITVGILVAFTGYTGMFWQPIVNISNFYNSLVVAMASAERIFEIMDLQPDIGDMEGARELPPIQGKVEFQEVHFSYDQDSPVLHDVSFTVQPGETIALVGPTGAGKITIVNLVSRFYDPDRGRVLIDDHDIREVTLQSLRSQMGIMLQDTFLFSTSILENIRYGRLDATDGEVMEAAKAVNAHEFIMELEDGYRTQVSERGSKLFVGQRQLISFARALLVDPRILILDEATSSIDTHTEILVQEALEKLLKGRTSFVIAHRLSTIRNADRIMIVDDNRIIETGTHQELMERRGFYYSLHMSQYRFLDDEEAGIA